MSLFRRRKEASDQTEVPPEPPLPPWTVAAGYHERTKHDFHRFAASLGYLDWDSQPNPFRTFEGAPRITLSFGEVPDTPYDALYEGRAPSGLAPSPERLSVFLEHSLAISAWKAIPGAQWALRCNPSSGNLHPTEGYLLVGPTSGMVDQPSLLHYCPEDHSLEQRAALDPEKWTRLTAAFPRDTFLVGLTSIHWREAWKYGERAYRYCQHDVGHALAAIVNAASLFGWRVYVLDGCIDEEAAALLGLDRADDFPVEAEREHPGMVAAVITHPSNESCPRDLPEDLLPVATAWYGRAAPLSPEHVEWQAIDAVAAACEKVEARSLAGEETLRSQQTDNAARKAGPSAAKIIRQRRSAVSMDGDSFLEREPFYRMLKRTMPHGGSPLWECLGAPVNVHLVHFVHRVHGLTPGLYLQVRDESKHEALAKAMKSDFLWQKATDAPAELPLYMLVEGNMQQTATSLSCQQDIAGMGAFSTAMIAEFAEPLHRYGAWIYRRLFWEAGMIGQVLYLEAEAAGLRATGIGCYFDNPVHRLLGLADQQFQSMYHFTIGGPVEDTRLSTLAPYNEERGYPLSRRG